MLQWKPILSYPNFNDTIILTTDASDYVAGAILSLMRDCKEVVIVYRVSKFQDPERNYNKTERDCLAVLIGLREFEPYLRGRHVTIYSDHATLKRILTRKQPPGQCLQLKKLHLKDPEYKQIIDYLEKDILPENDRIARKVLLTAHYYVMEKGVLYKIPTFRKKEHPNTPPVAS
jgi:hypothetical protein